METLAPTLTQLDTLLTWGPNWNTYDALAPNPQAVTHAKQWITDLYQCVQEWQLEWLEPSVTADAEGKAVFEWWNKPDKIEHHLTLYIGPADDDMMHFAYDGNKDRDMGDTPIKANEYEQIWKWLVGK